MSVKKIHDSLFVAYLKYQELTKSSKMSLMIFFFQAVLKKLSCFGSKLLLYFSNHLCKL